MSIAVSREKALGNLSKAWAALEDAKIVPSKKISLLISQVLTSADVTFKYILVTGCLAKYTEPKIHARALQSTSKLKEAYDARSLGHGVVVPFEKSKGDLFGLSNEPFVNKPARHHEHDGNNVQLRNKALAKVLHSALDYINKSDSKEVFACLVYILRIAQERNNKIQKIHANQKANLEKALYFGHKFLESADGGTRLVAIWAAICRFLYSAAEVKVGLPNQADKYGDTSGDIEVLIDGTIEVAVECKHRPLNADDVTHGLMKAAKGRVRQYVFVYADGIKKEDRDKIHKLLQGAAVDTGTVDAQFDLDVYIRSMLPIHRDSFGEEVVKILKDMKRADVAKAAADLWNSLETEGKT